MVALAYSDPSIATIILHKLVNNYTRFEPVRKGIGALGTDRTLARALTRHDGGPNGSSGPARRNCSLATFPLRPILDRTA